MNLELEREMFQRVITAKGYGPYLCAYGINLFPESKMPVYFEISTFDFLKFDVKVCKFKVDGFYKPIAKGIDWQNVNIMIDIYRIDPPKKKHHFCLVVRRIGVLIYFRFHDNRGCREWGL